MTMAVCPPGSLDSEFLQNLAKEISYVIEDGKLALSLRYDSGIMTFVQ